MSALVTTSNAVDQVQSLAAAIRGISDVEGLTEARARIEAAKGWAKIHGQARALRLDLLKLEVLALVRIVELGGADTLGRDREVAEWLASLGEQERDKFVRESGASTTTAAGMVRSIWRIQKLENENRQYRSAGRAFAEEPPAPSEYDEAAIKDAKRWVNSVAGSLAKTADYFMPKGESFSIDQMAESVIEDSAVDADLAADPAFVEGVREVCRRVVRDAPALTLDGLPVPAFITARDSDGNYIRIPTVNATLAHVSEMVELKRLQLAQAQEALNRMEKFDSDLRSMPGANDDSRVGRLLATSVIETAA